MKLVNTYLQFINESNNLFNDRPSKLSKEILDIALKGLPKYVIDNIAEVEPSGYGLINMVTPQSITNKG